MLCPAAITRVQSGEDSVMLPPPGPLFRPTVMSKLVPEPAEAGAVIVKVFWTKLAVTFLFVVTLFSVHMLPLVLSQPVKPVNEYTAPAVAVQVTVAPYETGFAGVQPTALPPVFGLGVAVTVEVIAVKVAVTFLFDVTLFSVHMLPLVLSQPVKLVNVKPVPAVAAQLTLAP